MCMLLEDVNENTWRPPGVISETLYLLFMVSLWPLLFTDTSRSRGGEGAGAVVSLKKKKKN